MLIGGRGTRKQQRCARSGLPSTSVCMHRPSFARLKLAVYNNCRAHAGLNLVNSQPQQQDAAYQGPPGNLHASEIWRRQTWKEQQQSQHAAPSLTLPLHRGQLPLRPSPGHSRLGHPVTGQASLQARGRQDQQLIDSGPAAAHQAAQLSGPGSQVGLKGFPMPAARSGTRWQYREAPAGQDAHMPGRHQSLQQPEDFTDGWVNAAGPELAQQQAHDPGQQPALWSKQVFRQQQASCTSHGHLLVHPVHTLGALPLLLPLPHASTSASPAATCIHIRDICRHTPHCCLRRCPRSALPARALREVSISRPTNTISQANPCQPAACWTSTPKPLRPMRSTPCPRACLQPGGQWAGPWPCSALRHRETLFSNRGGPTSGPCSALRHRETLFGTRGSPASLPCPQ